MSEHVPEFERILSCEISAEDDEFLLSEISVFNEMLAGLKNKLSLLEQSPDSNPVDQDEIREEIADLENQIALREEYSEFLDTPDNAVCS